jgi:hypothetical protein
LATRSATAEGATGRPSVLSPGADLALFVLLLALALVASPWLRVYHRITVVRAELVEIDREGRRRVLETPPALDLAAARYRPADDLPRRAEAAFRRWVVEPGPAAWIRDGARFEWRIAYAGNSRTLDRRLVLVAPEAADRAR